MTGMDSHTHGILLYDGECLFCHASMRFIVDRDAAGYFRFGAADRKSTRLNSSHT